MRLITIIHATHVWFLLCATAFNSVKADDVTPAPITFTAPKEATGTGKRNDPFIFTSETKCVLKLNGATDAVFDLEDAPADIEVIGGVVVFSLSSPGDYVIIAHGASCYAKAWFTIKGPNGPPQPVNQIESRIRASLTGHADDAKRFKAACDALAASLEAGEIKTLGQMEDALAAGLKAVAWPTGKYADVSKLAGELFGAGVPDGPIDAETKSRFVANLKTISRACESVK